MGNDAPQQEPAVRKAGVQWPAVVKAAGVKAPVVVKAAGVKLPSGVKAAGEKGSAVVKAAGVKWPAVGTAGDQGSEVSCEASLGVWYTERCRMKTCGSVWSCSQ